MGRDLLSVTATGIQLVNATECLKRIIPTQPRVLQRTPGGHILTTPSKMTVSPAVLEVQSAHQRSTMKFFARQACPILASMLCGLLMSAESDKKLLLDSEVEQLAQNILGHELKRTGTL